jgi:hypothetical protein
MEFFVRGKSIKKTDEIQIFLLFGLIILAFFAGLFVPSKRGRLRHRPPVTTENVTVF